MVSNKDLRHQHWKLTSITLFSLLIEQPEIPFFKNKLQIIDYFGHVFFRAQYRSLVDGGVPPVVRIPTTGDSDKRVPGKTIWKANNESCREWIAEGAGDTYLPLFICDGYTRLRAAIPYKSGLIESTLGMECTISLREFFDILYHTLTKLQLQLFVCKITKYPQKCALSWFSLSHCGIYKWRGLKGISPI